VSNLIYLLIIANIVVLQNFCREHGDRLFIPFSTPTSLSNTMKGVCATFSPALLANARHPLAVSDIFKIQRTVHRQPISDSMPYDALVPKLSSRSPVVMKLSPLHLYSPSSLVKVSSPFDTAIATIPTRRFGKFIIFLFCHSLICSAVLTWSNG
jgi:hypothetical protein